jgi:hypothetical protein
MVSFDPMDTSTHIPAKSPSLASSPIDVFYTPSSKTTSPNLTTAKPTPPNFPHPTPLSWLVFAAPKAHLLTYPETIENHDEIASKYPSTIQPTTIHKRIDYDFSFSGIPLFEFSSADVFTTTGSSKRTEFLSIEQMGGWCEQDPYLAYSEEEYKRMYSLWEDGEWDIDGSRYGSSGGGLDDEGMPKAPMPPPNRGVWWKVFYERMCEDAVRWEKVRKAMGRGKCRVVMRWIEAPCEGDIETGQRGGVAGGRQGVGAGGKKGAQGKRITRSETKRRSSLGMSDPVGLAIGGVVGMEALGESKSRAAGNRELGRAVGGLGEREIAKARKR